MPTATGFVQLRRGILEHLTDGRITSDEFAAYTVLILNANRHTGNWRGSGATLARIVHWEARKACRVLASLAKKGYIAIKRVSGSLQAYLFSVAKYFRAAVKRPRQPTELRSFGPVEEQEVNLQDKRENARDTAARHTAQAIGSRLQKETAARAEADVGAYVRPAVMLCNLCQRRMPWELFASHECPAEKAASA
jgi:hypothetical protein